MRKKNKENLQEKYKLKSKVKHHKLIKDNKITVVVKESKPEPYRSYYFKKQFEEDKRSLFL